MSYSVFFPYFYSIYRLCQPSFSLRPYQIHIKCTSISDLIYIHYIYCFTRIIRFVLFLFSLPFQTMSTVDFIDTLSKTDSYWHEHWRCSWSPFRRSTGNDVNGPLFSPLFFFFPFFFPFHSPSRPFLIE